jgi:hypothetical protein
VEHRSKYTAEQLAEDAVVVIVIVVFMVLLGGRLASCRLLRRARWLIVVGDLLADSLQFPLSRQRGAHGQQHHRGEQGVAHDAILPEEMSDLVRVR